MTYTIKDHGVWKPYVPDPMPSWATEAGLPGVPAFLKRETDGVDFYKYRNSGQYFTAGSVQATTLFNPVTGREVVKSVFGGEEVNHVFPLNQRLIEIIGVESRDGKPHNLFTEMTFDPSTLTLSGTPGLKFNVVTLKKDLWTRATVDEADKIDAFVTKQTVRDQRIFNETAAINHADPLYAELLAGFTDLFGLDRASQILASS